ncbi:MAG: ABC transporter substrate-binding protein [Blautia sp.]|nr:ABC transporter substrate-binding protein [Blautia sp.]
MKKMTKVIGICAAAAMVMTTGTAAFAEEGTFTIGAIGPVTGAAAAYGISVMNGAQLAVDEINASGGINGYQVELITADDEHDAEKSVNAYNDLKDKGMQMLLGTVTSAPCIAVEGEALNDNMFLLTPSGSAVDCITGENAFRVCFADPAQGAKSAQFIGEHGLATKIGIIYDSSDPYSTGIMESFVAEADSQGLEVVSNEAFSDNRTDFSAQLNKAKDAEAELVFLPFYYQEAALVLKQASDMGFAPTFFGCDGMDGILTVENFDTSLAEGLMLLTPFTPNAEDEMTQNFVAAYEEAFDGLVPIQFGADAYDGIYAMKAALEDADANPDMSASELCDLMKVSMGNITVEGLTGTITWDPATGEPEKEPKAVVIENGEYVSQD